MFWDFITLRPETMHQVSFLFSDRGIPDGYRHMNGYGSHTFKLVNKKGNEYWVKFHYKVSSREMLVAWKARRFPGVFEMLRWLFHLLCCGSLHISVYV